MEGGNQAERPPGQSPEVHGERRTPKQAEKPAAELVATPAPARSAGQESVVVAMKESR